MTFSRSVVTSERSARYVDVGARVIVADVEVFSVGPATSDALVRAAVSASTTRVTVRP